MNSYCYQSLKSAADEAGVWIDVQDAKVRRGKNTGNTDKKERISRALSWHAKSESVDAADDRLIFAFVAFNSLYAREGEGKEKDAHKTFLSKLAKTSGVREIFNFALAEKKTLRNILSSQYLSKIYWKDEGGMREKAERLEWEKNQVDSIVPRLKSGDIAPVREAVYRICLLRNQVLHGMAAYADSYNRTQVKLCAGFLHPLVGRMIAAVIHDKKQKWGKVPYPPQGYPNETRVEVEELAE